jgi:orotidine-5'-phosphate decarboxylase
MTGWVRRIKPWAGLPTDGKPWVADVRSFDIPETVGACIRNAAAGCVAISLSRLGGREMVEAAEAAAKERGIRVLWWTGPFDPREFVNGKPTV